jgi:hypothetical protein
MSDCKAGRKSATTPSNGQPRTPGSRRRPDEHDPITTRLYQSRERTRFFDVARLHRRCSGPCQRNGSWSTWPRSHGVPGSIRRPHRAHNTPPPATFRAQPARNALCLAPYFSTTTPSGSPDDRRRRHTKNGLPWLTVVERFGSAAPVMCDLTRSLSRRRVAGDPPEGPEACDREGCAMRMRLGPWRGQRWWRCS